MTKSKPSASRHDRGSSPSGIRIVGLKVAIFTDLYYFFLKHSWRFFYAFVTVLYLTSNGVFAGLYLLGGDGALANARPGSFADAFFFSVQTMGTIGYGYVYPTTLYANMLVTVESLFGLLSLAMVTGMTFAKFSRPRARVMFSDRAVVTMHDGVMTLMFRMANSRSNMIAEASLHVAFLKVGKTLEGRPFNRMQELDLVRRRSPAFSLTWTALHPVIEGRAFFGESVESLAAGRAQLLCSLTGYDSTTGQTIHARHTYAAKDIVFGVRLVDILTPATSVVPATIDYTHFHGVEAD